MAKTINTVKIRGLIIALGLILIDLFGSVFNLKTEHWFMIMPSIILCGSIAGCSLYYDAGPNNDITFRNTFKFGFRISLLVAVILTIYAPFAVYFISPEIVDQAMDEARRKMESNGGFSEEIIEQTIEASRKFFIPIYIASPLISITFYGTIGSLIGAALVKKKHFPILEEIL